MYFRWQNINSTILVKVPITEKILTVFSLRAAAFTMYTFYVTREDLICGEIQRLGAPHFSLLSLSTSSPLRPDIITILNIHLHGQLLKNAVSRECRFLRQRIIGKLSLQMP